MFKMEIEGFCTKLKTQYRYSIAYNITKLNLR